MTVNKLTWHRWHTTAAMFETPIIVLEMYLTFTITEFLQTLMHQLCQSSSVRVTNGAAVSDVFRCPSKQFLEPLLQ